MSAGKMIRHGLVLLLVSTPALAQDAGSATWSKIHAGLFAPPLRQLPRRSRQRADVVRTRSSGRRRVRTGCTSTPGQAAGVPSTSPAAPVTPPATRNCRMVRPALPCGCWRRLRCNGSASRVPGCCAQIEDPARNGGRTIAAVADHVADDAVVRWGWAPGPGREPAPYSAAEVAAFLKQWDAAGAPCPAQ